MSALARRESAATREVCDALAADLRLLCRLHDREIDAALLGELCRVPVRDWFAIALAGPEAETGIDVMARALAGLSSDPGAAELDELAADYADIYLTFGARAAPNESYWLTEDHIERQEPMFSVREWYAHYGLGANDWRKRADDHLVHEIEFVARLLELAEPHAQVDAARFLDLHLLAWLPAFCGGVAARAATPFYAGLALVTLAHLQATRDLLETITGETRAAPPALPGEGHEPSEGPGAGYHPGAGPGW